MTFQAGVSYCFLKGNGVHLLSHRGICHLPSLPLAGFQGDKKRATASETRQLCTFAHQANHRLVVKLLQLLK